MTLPWITLTLVLVLAACVSYPPALSPTKDQTADQQTTDAKACDHEVHGAARLMTMDVFTTWSSEQRDKYVACMQRKGYTLNQHLPCSLAQRRNNWCRSERTLKRAGSSPVVGAPALRS